MDIQYIVIEIQTNTNGQIGTLINSYDNSDQAQSKYHQILAAAAISTLPKHAATLLASDGSYIEHRCYEHAQEVNNE